MRHLIVVVAFALAVTGCTAGCDLHINSSPASAPHPTNPTPVVPPPTINTFAADATRLGPPNGPLIDTYLRWDVTGTSDTRCRLDSSGPPVQTIGNVPIAGAVQVRPQVSRDYVLACTNAGGTVVRVVSILVG